MMETFVTIFLLSLPLLALVLFLLLRTLNKKETQITITHCASAGNVKVASLPNISNSSQNFFVSTAYSKAVEKHQLKNCLVEGNSLLKLGIRHGDIVGIRELTSDTPSPSTPRKDDIIYLQKEPKTFLLRAFLNMVDAQTMNTISYNQAGEKEIMEEPLNSLKGTMLVYTTPK